MARRTKTLTNQLKNKIENKLEDVDPAALVGEAIVTYFRNTPTFTSDQLGVITDALVRNYPWKDIDGIFEDIDALPWN